MDDLKALQDALYSIKPSDLSYEEWLNVGMALKDEGLSVNLWDDWSRSDSRYEYGVCANKWKSFSGSGVGVGTIFHYAETYGDWSRSRDLDWDDGIFESDYYHDVLDTEKKPDEQPCEMPLRYIETMYQPDEPVNVVVNSEFQEKRDKWTPIGNGAVRKANDIIKDLKKYKDLEYAFRTINTVAGAWIRHNPSTGSRDENVVRFDHVLVESDSLSIEEQKKLLINLKLPITALIESGGKSVHALVKVQAKDAQEYDQRAKFLFDYLSKHSFLVVNANKNPARLSRLPGAMRDGKLQKLLATNIGCSSWAEWIDYINGVDDDLPQIDSLWDMFEAPDEMPEEIISSILYEGGKMIITGDSKSGKTCLSQNLTVCIASGQPWLGKYHCKQGRVLYINLEIRKEMLKRRFRSMFKDLNIEPSHSTLDNIRTWNLRGKALPLDQLAAKIIRRARADGPFLAIIIDPVYKVQQGDENSAESISKFCNALDKIAEETGAAIIYDHHHPKGDVGNKKAIDRGAGSGVFARDADAMIDISNIVTGNDAADAVLEMIKEGERPMEMSFVLRDFPDRPSQKIWFKYPVHFLDRANLLENCYIEGSDKANFSKNPNRISDDEKRRIIEDAFFECRENGRARIADMATYAEKDKKTIKKYVVEVGGFDTSERGFVKRNTDDFPDVLK